MIMNHLKDYIAKKTIIEDIEYLSQLNESLEDIKRDISYKKNSIKRKWNNFWDWLFGEDTRDEEQEYNYWSDDYDDAKFSKFVNKNKDEFSELDITWIKIDQHYDENRRKINEMLKRSNEKEDYGFWRTDKILKSNEIKTKYCKFVLGKITLESDDEKSSTIALMFTIYENLILIDVLKKYAGMIDWENVKDYLYSSKFRKNMIEKNKEVKVTMHSDFSKYAKQMFDNMKPDKNKNILSCTLDNDVSESIDVENLAWKINKYFENKSSQYNQFVNLVHKFEEQHSISDDDIQEFLDKSFVDLKKFIDFICEDIDLDEQRDYMYLLRKVVQNIIGDKTITL